MNWASGGRFIMADFSHTVQPAPAFEYYRLAVLNTCDVDILKFSGQLY
jgi:hypothetical protein